MSRTILEVVEHFQYLRSHLSQQASIEANIQHRICCARTSFRKLRNRVYDNHNLREDTKVMAYKAVCINTLLYGREAWIIYRCHLKNLDNATNVSSERFFVSDGKVAAPTRVSSLRLTRLASMQL